MSAAVPDWLRIIVTCPTTRFAAIAAALGALDVDRDCDDCLHKQLADCVRVSAYLDGRLTDKVLLADVISQAVAADAKVVLAGDTQQLQAVQNGGGLSLLGDALGCVQLAEPVRFRAAWEQAAACGCVTGTARWWPTTTSTPGSPAVTRSR